MPVVWIPAPLRSCTQGRETVDVEGTTLLQVIDSLEASFPGIKARLCDENGLRPGIAVAIGTQLARRGLSEPVPHGAEVHFLPAIAGGGACER
jgi:molybdopterin synthase sulfur carrier subunit